MHQWDPALLHSMLEDEKRRCSSLETELLRERQIAIHWEHEAKALRKELNHVRQNSDTEVLLKSE